MKLTDAAVRGLQPGKEVRDAASPGLAIRRQTDAITFYFLWQKHGKAHRLRIGRYPEVGLAEARDIAFQHRKTLEHGGWPGVTISAAATVADLLDLYYGHLRDTAKRPEQPKALLEKHVRPAIGVLPLEKLHRRDLQRLVDTIRPKSVAGAVGRYLTAAMVFGEKRGHVEAAIRNLDLPPTGEPRQRVLSQGELKVLMADWLPRGIDAPARSSFGAIFALCLLTGARRSEIAELRYSEIDMGRGVITLSAERSKGDRETYVCLSSFALRVLKAWPQTHDEIVFPVERPRAKPGQGGDRPGRPGRGFVSGFSRAAEDCRRRTGTDAWTIHDLRRTCATGMQRAGVAPHLIDAALNHAPPRLARTYAVAHPITEIRGALETFGANLTSSIWKPPH